MSEPVTERPPVHVVKFRGGMGDGVFRLALGHVPPGVTVERDGARQDYEYAGPEEQWDHRYVWDKAANKNVQVSRMAAVYHIYRPVAEARARP